MMRWPAAKRRLIGVWLVIGALVTVWASGAKPLAAQFRVWLPLVLKPGVTFEPLPDYGSLPIFSDPTDRPAGQHPDLNLALRGYMPSAASLELVDLGGRGDPAAPQLSGLCASWDSPTIVSAWHVHDWDWPSDQRGAPITAPEATLIGIMTQPRELVRLPQSGYDIGEGLEALVLYAAEDRITFKYTREDNVVHGYTLHVEGVDVDPELVRIYQELDAAGRHSLPALDGGQPFGWAAGDQVLVAVRDSGTFLDPRSRKDWWQDP